MKKVLCVVLSLTIVFLSGCSALFTAQTGLAEITGLDMHTNYVSSADLGEDYWVLLSSVFVPEEKENRTTTVKEEAAQEDNFYDDMEEQGTFYYMLNLVNPRTAKVIRSAEIKDCPFEDITGVRFEEDGNILVYNEFDNKSVLYSSKLKRISDALPFHKKSVDTLAKKNKLFDEIFARYDSFASDYIEFFDDNRVNAYLFYGENDKLYFADNERFSPFCGVDKLVLGTMITDGISKRDTIRVYDFEKAVLVNEIDTPDFGEDKLVSFSSATLMPESAFVIISEYTESEQAENEDSFKYHYYLWNYKCEALNTPFSLECCTKAQLKEKSQQLCAAIKKDYGVEVFINKANQSTIDKDEVYALNLKASVYKSYYTLIGIRAFFEHLPAGFVKETYTGMEHIEPAGFRIYIAKNIVGFPNAYANRWGEYFEIALSADGFSMDTFSHEFMHIIDARLDDYYWEKGLDSVWEARNPKGFSYMGYEDMDSEEWDEAMYEKYQQSFVSRYAMSEATEDRADTFSSLFTCGAYANSEPPYWYRKGSACATKAVLLCRMIRKAFPCMQGAPQQYWEKCLSEQDWVSTAQ